MKPTILACLLTLSLAATGAAQAAQYMDAKTLRAAATGVRFKSGQDMFRMLPGTVVSEHTPPRNATSAQRSAAKAGITGAVSPGDKVAARIGPYAVVLDAPAGAARSLATDAERPIAAAVNERNGRVVLVNPQVKLTGTTPAAAKSLAASTGGTIAYASTVDGSAVITYASVEQAQRALPGLQRSSGVAQAALVVMQAVMQPM
ncbi:hypothetical protein ABFO19_15100 [Xanthomonas citri pv. glycines]|uniref:Uncharacterized protein n=1 Tax=Xanthomonas campestris pv. glycines TaxID=473421 RepID=A0AAX0HZK4_XANCG|nr:MULTISPECIES: hypothetical protein [Xanthomonas]AOY62385.1 hypothetical protein BHE84_09570 [Xanthomonas citri pv. glycines str. 8ra]ARV23915.1 hypothetical protein A9D66_15275 [Xanthomonas citri pv. glycines str. 12-2]EWC51947.1 hypothetical protein XAR_1245 [Xanthomonas citri pv. glycines str. 8ra]OEY90011.1 hypothetical protein BIY41_15275 [Xanthomonas citri pv. glycines]OOX01184.1 hypothetical protein Xgly_18150 [Xanthomonas citri pv. glycines]